MDEKALAKMVDDLEMENTFGNIIMAGMFSLMVVIIMAQYLQGFSASQMEVSTLGYPAVAANNGLVWIQMTPTGVPNQVKVISENSSGAFEEVLLGLTT